MQGYLRLESAVDRMGLDSECAARHVFLNVDRERVIEGKKKDDEQLEPNKKCKRKQE